MAVGKPRSRPRLSPTTTGPESPEGPAHQAHGQFDVALGEGLPDGGAADGEDAVLDYVLADDFVTIVLSQPGQSLKVSLAVLAKGEVLPADEDIHVESFGKSLHELSGPEAVTLPW